MSRSGIWSPNELLCYLL